MHDRSSRMTEQVQSHRSAQVRLALGERRIQLLQAAAGVLGERLRILFHLTPAEPTRLGEGSLESVVPPSLQLVS